MAEKDKEIEIKVVFGASIEELNRLRTRLECTRCDHKWYSRKNVLPLRNDMLPLRCPRCGSSCLKAHPYFARTKKKVGKLDH